MCRTCRRMSCGTVAESEGLSRTSSTWRSGSAQSARRSSSDDKELARTSNEPRRSHAASGAMRATRLFVHRTAHRVVAQPTSGARSSTAFEANDTLRNGSASRPCKEVIAFLSTRSSSSCAIAASAASDVSLFPDRSSVRKWRCAASPTSPASPMALCDRSTAVRLRGGGNTSLRASDSELPLTSRRVRYGRAASAASDVSPFEGSATSCR